MMDLVEEVARAMWDENRRRVAEVGILLDDWEIEKEALRQDWRALAYAAIDVIRKHGGPLPVYGLDEIPEKLL